MDKKTLLEDHKMGGRGSFEILRKNRKKNRQRVQIPNLSVTVAKFNFEGQKQQEALV